MKMHKIAGAVGVAMVLATGSAQAFIIDSFDDGLIGAVDVFAGGGPGATASGTQTGAAADILGGSRDVDLLMTEGNGTTFVSSVLLSGSNSVFDINNGNTERSVVTVTWDDMGSTDMTEGGLNLGIFMSLPSPIDNDMDVTFTLTDSGSATSARTENYLDGASGADFFIQFSNFVGTADLTDIVSIEMSITAGAGAGNLGLDTQIDFVETRPAAPPSVPAPATLLLMGAGLAGFGARRWKRA